MIVHHETAATQSARTPPDDGSAEAPPIRHIGRYRVLGLLGRGGMGVVFAAFDDLLDRKVAIKRLHSPGDTTRTHARLLREGQALARLAHPSVVTVHEITEVDGQIHIIMEFVAGRTLRAWIAERRPSRDEILRALEQAGRGVAAAHAAGLVHCDLKPENIMVGDDGRVRVMDFGLARAAETHRDDAALVLTATLPANLLATPVTVGAQLGTPGYMAPEQYRERTADTRSDIFSFCVVLFEALSGQRLFTGDTWEIRDLTLAGAIRPGAAKAVPAWLEAIIGRGLALEPDRRWPTMDALLAALARDPVARRRRILWGAAGAMALAALVAGAIFGSIAIAAAREHAVAEAQAQARLAAVEARITRAEADGDPVAAAAAFEAFVADPAHRDTRALSTAWRHRGDRLRAEPAAAQGAYAEAYALARGPADATAALRELAAVFHATWNGDALARAVALLRTRGVEDAALAEQALDAALWRRDLDGALAELRPGHPGFAWRPTLTHLAGATSTRLPALEISVLPADSSARLAVRSNLTEVVLLDEALTEVDRWSGDVIDVRLIAGTSWGVARGHASTEVLDLAAAGEVLWRGPVAPSIYQAAALGPSSVVFGRISPVYGFRRWDLRGGASERIADVATDRIGSAVEAFALDDLDGDGGLELAVGVAEWHAFDLRIFRVDGDGELELAAQRRLGRVGALATVRRGARRLLAVVTDESSPAPDLFPTPPHTGARAGVHLFAWSAGALAEVGFVAMPRAGGVGRFVAEGRHAAGDFDGDGREDLAFELHERGEPWLLLLRQTEAGFEPIHVGDLRLLGAAQLDDDAMPELLVNFHRDEMLVVLGKGDGRLSDASEAPGPAPPRPTALTDPLLVERWARADELASFGLLDSAAAVLRKSAMLAADPREQVALLDRAGDLYHAAGRHEDVLAVDRQVRDDPARSEGALVRDTLVQVALGRYDEAFADASLLSAAAASRGERAATACSLRDELAALVDPRARLELRFDAPLSSAWRFLTPGVLRRDPTRSALEFTIPAAEVHAAELPFVWDGGPLALEFEIEVEDLEYGACVKVYLADDAGESWLGGALCGRGGGGKLMRSVHVKVFGTEWLDVEAPSVADLSRPQALHARLACFPGRSACESMVRIDGRVSVGHHPLPKLPPAGRHRLMIGSPAWVDAPGLAVGVVRRIVLRGVRPVEPAPGEVTRERPAWLLAENQPGAALAAIAGAAEPHPRATTVELLARAELRDLAGLAAAAPAVVRTMDDPAWLPDLVLALRMKPLAGAALRSAAGPAILPVLDQVWSLVEPHRNDPHMWRRALEGLTGIESLTPTTLGERRALRRLLAARGRTWLRSGEAGRARADFTAALALSRDDADTPELELIAALQDQLARVPAPRASRDGRAAG